MAAFNEAVEAAPGDLDTLLQRAFFFEQLADLVVEEQREQFESLARADYAEIAERIRTPSSQVLRGTG